MVSKMWEPDKKDYEIINDVYEAIKKQLSDLHQKTGCPDLYVYNFIGSIQNEWHPKSCHSIARKNKRVD